MAATFCPNCDGMLGNGHCVSCGFNAGEPLTRKPQNPFVEGRVYGKYTDETGELVVPVAPAPPVEPKPEAPKPDAPKPPVVAQSGSKSVQ